MEVKIRAPYDHEPNKHVSFPLTTTKCQRKHWDRLILCDISCGIVEKTKPSIKLRVYFL